MNENESENESDLGGDGYAEIHHVAHAAGYDVVLDETGVRWGGRVIDRNRPLVRLVESGVLRVYGPDGGPLEDVPTDGSIAGIASRVLRVLAKPGSVRLRLGSHTDRTVLYTDGHGWSAWAVTVGATGPGAPVHGNTAREAWEKIGSPARILFSTGGDLPTVERESLTIEQVEEWVKAQQPQYAVSEAR